DVCSSDLVSEVAPEEGDILVPKRHPSAFFGTPLVSYLVEAGVDSLVVTGCTTSGCVRSSVTDAFSYNFRVSVPADAVYARSPVVHEVNLFDMAQQYADVPTTDALLAALPAAGGKPPRAHRLPGGPGALQHPRAEARRAAGALLR